MFTRAHHWALSWARCIQSTPSHPVYLKSGVRFPKGRGRDFFLFVKASRPALGPNAVSYTMGIADLFSGAKAAGAWYWPLTSIQCRS